MKEKRIILVVLIGIMVSGVILMYSSFALFSQNQITKSAITIKAGTMTPTVKVDGAIGTSLTVPAGSSKTFTVTLENLNSEQGKFLFYYLGSLPTGVKFGYLEESEKNNPPGTSGVTLAKNGKQTYSLYVTNTSSSSVTINLGSLGGLSNQPLSLPSNGHIIEKISIRNSNITHIYAYDKSTCVTGGESTCKEIATPSTYTPGTIVKYKVNNTTEKYFHVISDNKTTLTLQDRDNTVSSIAWYGLANYNFKGPTTILSAIESATSGWSNVLTQTYTLGTTVFKDNAYTGCHYSTLECATNTYTLDQRSVKARIISLQEAKSLGCSTSENSCPLWMYNGLVDGTTNHAYWTLTADSSDVYEAMVVNYNGRLHFSDARHAYQAGRAVIQIQK